MKYSESDGRGSALITIEGFFSDPLDGCLSRSVAYSRTMTVTIPSPIVDWETVVALSDPLHAPSRQRLRSLRVRANLSPGVQVTMRRNGRAAGSVVYYSALSALSAKARQSGDLRAAADLGKAGAELERWISDALRQFLATSTVEELDEAPFYDELVRRTGTALDAITIDFVLMSGRVNRIEGDLARVIADSDGDTDVVPVRVDLPVRLVEQAGVPVGGHLWIMRQIVGSAAVLTVLPAIQVDDEDRGRHYLEHGPGAPISDAEVAYFRDLAPDSLPTARVLRPAG